MCVGPTRRHACSFSKGCLPCWTVSAKSEVDERRKLAQHLRRKSLEHAGKARNLRILLLVVKPSRLLLQSLEQKRQAGSMPLYLCAEVCHILLLAYGPFDSVIAILKWSRAIRWCVNASEIYLEICVSKSRRIVKLCAVACCMASFLTN